MEDYAIQVRLRVHMVQQFLWCQISGIDENARVWCLCNGTIRYLQPRPLGLERKAVPSEQSTWTRPK
jgi:hypothetical protein